MRDPEAFLLDEPLSNLDAKIRSSARIELKRLHDQLKQTFVFVTHDQSEAMTLADRLVIVDHGRLLQYDTPERVLRDPASQFVASFVGSPDMVFLEGAVESRAGAASFVLGPVRIPVRGETAPGPVTLGIRPWDVSIGPANAPGGIPAVVRGVERLGSSDQLYLELTAPGAAPAPGVSVRAMGRAYENQVGDSVSVSIDPDHALFFDKDGARVHSLETAPPA